MTGDKAAVSPAEDSAHTETAEGASHNVDTHVSAKELIAPSIHVEGDMPSDQPQNESQPSREGTPPPLPPRPQNAQLLSVLPKDSTGSLKIPKGAGRPRLQSKATTALSLTDVHTQLHGDGPGATLSPASRQLSINHGFKSQSGSEHDDSGSVRSYAPSIALGGDTESLLGEVRGGPGWQNMEHQSGHSTGAMGPLFPDDPELDEAFEHEFDDLEDVKADGSNEGQQTFRLRERLLILYHP